VTKSIFDAGLQRRPANHQPLTPLTFLERAADVFPDRPAVIHGDQRFSYVKLRERSRRLASALAARGIGPGDTVAVMLANTPPMIECHYGVPLAGAVLNTLNTRLDAATIAYILDHGEAKALITDREYSPVIREALALAQAKPLVVDYDDPTIAASGDRLGVLDYEALLAEGDPLAPGLLTGVNSRDEVHLRRRPAAPPGQSPAADAPHLPRARRGRLSRQTNGTPSR
jgi:fatty-acyl-CoA synthase